MNKTAAALLQPRKTPVQARSTASVDAILQATVQVLLQEGKMRLTTTRVAQRAGVSVGTLYQYFPNKRSLLGTLLQQHLDRVALAVEAACKAAHGSSLADMGEAITTAFVRAKFQHIDASAALYAISDDVEGKRIAGDMHVRATKAMTALFETAPGRSIAHPGVVAATLLSAMAGVSRTMLEGGVKRGTMVTMETELARMARAYLEASASMRL